MYGLPKDTTLSFLIGKEICQVAVGSYDLQLKWGSGGLSIWQMFVYKVPGQPDIVWQGESPELAARMIRLLKSSIAAVWWNENGKLELTFSNGDRLEVLDSDKRYEAYSIQDGKTTIIV